MPDKETSQQAKSALSAAADVNVRPVEVSVVIAAHAAARFIAGAVRSALDQSLATIEVIVVDDASPDDTVEAAAKAGDADPRLRIVRLSRNLGPGGARNVGFAMARGRFVAILDADDRMQPERLARLRDFADAQNADIVADDLLLIAPSGIAARPRRFLNWREARLISLEAFALANRALERSRHLGYLKPMFRREFLSAHRLRYDCALRIGEDYALIAEALAVGARYVVAPFAGYHYSLRPGSISRGKAGFDLYAPLLIADQAFRARHAPRLAPAERAALDVRHASLRDASAFTRLAEMLKAKRFREAAQIAINRPFALRHIGLPIAARLRRAATQL